MYIYIYIYIYMYTCVFMEVAIDLKVCPGFISIDYQLVINAHKMATRWHIQTFKKRCTLSIKIAKILALIY